MPIFPSAQQIKWVWNGHMDQWQLVKFGEDKNYILGAISGQLWYDQKDNKFFRGAVIDKFGSHPPLNPIVKFSSLIEELFH